jgi:DNA-binding NtrC family response regulator
LNNDNKRRILTVDDEPDITLAVKAGLEATGLFQVDTFNDPELALSSFRPGSMTWHLSTLKCQNCTGMNFTTNEKDRQ